jgi:Fe-S-cluster-containing hydrogenase component 2
MGIDVRAYAMANEHVKRAACVGCGMRAHVCPRGVLRLENSPERFKGGTAPGTPHAAQIPPRRGDLRSRNGTRPTSFSCSPTVS